MELQTAGSYSNTANCSLKCLSFAGSLDRVLEACNAFVWVMTLHFVSACIILDRGAELEKSRKLKTVPDIANGQDHTDSTIFLYVSLITAVYLAK